MTYKKERGMGMELKIPENFFVGAASGAWGMAVLAAFMMEKEEGEELPDYLSEKIFAGQTGTTIAPKPEDVEGFDRFVERYRNTLPAEKAAAQFFVSE